MVDGLRFRDLNKDGGLDPFEDPRRPIDERIDQLLRQSRWKGRRLLFHPVAVVRVARPAVVVELVRSHQNNAWNDSFARPERGMPVSEM